MLQFLHLTVYPQSLHIINVEYPLLFKNNIVCLFCSKFFSISEYKSTLSIERFPFASSCFKSTTSTLGNDELLALLVSFKSSISSFSYDL